MSDENNTPAEETPQPLIRIHDEVAEERRERDMDDVTDFRKPMVEGAEPVAAAAVAPAQAHAAHDAHDTLSDTVVLMGREVTVPGGIYTVVFIALGIATLLEVIIFELPRGPLTIPLMLAFGVIKAALVVMYYMHLRTDSRIFTATLMIPVGMALVATLFLMAVPVTGY